MRIDDSWRDLAAPDFSLYAGLDPERRIMMMGADPFAPDKCLPDHVIDATKQALDDGKTHYSLDNGYAEPRLKTALVNKLWDFNGMEIDPETELMVGPSSAFTLFLSIRICIRPGQGDEVLVTSPGFAENINDIHQMGAVCVEVPTYEEDGFALRMDEFRSRITERTRAIVITNPNNPTGTVYTRENLMELAALAEEFDLGVIVDQDFERQIYDGAEYVNFATLPGMRERTLTVFGTSKDLGLTGFRVGYLVAPAEIMPLLKIATFNYVGPTNTFAQYGVAAAYENPAYTDEWFTIYDQRRHAIFEALQGIPGVGVTMPAGGFYHWVNISELGTSLEVVKHLVETQQLGVSPGNWFGNVGEGYIRVMYGSNGRDEIFREGVSRLASGLRELAELKGVSAAA
ncbi:pyridoxal phosphate-dependent aminotransferase [Salinibacterium sp. SWN248]|uniref:pyridoxal phosphate-dependent aminotransferase n=1 Tax=Salinibacterium sp. SWN248 TaxID=2792056 RepID=UPI0018CEF383|nr:pyridoxal phosphate-dependent aminotransferase [Salinibacterium sp. SWN248]MBH0023008.1 pyridoxal phosphate-dependent aminotransferase [Salinibacterium sp. SWN248]